MMVIAIIVFQGFVFLSMIFLLRHFMKGHLSGAMGHLQKLNDELIKQQVDLKAKISDAQKEYDSKMVKLQQEVNARQAQIREEANKTIEESRTRALAEREKIINEAVSTRDKMRQEIMAEMEEKAIQHSRELIGQFFSGEMRTVVHNTLMKEAIDGLKDMKLEGFQIDSAVAELKCTEPLSAEFKNQIGKILKDKIKKDVQFKEEIDPSLVGGVILKFGTFVIDASVMNRLKEAAAEMKKETARKYQGTV